MNTEYKANSLSESNNVASLCSIRKRNLNKSVVAHLNINSLRFRFDSLYTENNRQCRHSHDI